MLPDIVPAIEAAINSVLAPFPAASRPYVILAILAAVLGGIGSLGRDAPDNTLDRIRRGVSVTCTAANTAVEAVVPVVRSGVVAAGRGLISGTTTAVRTVWNSGSSLVEVEEAPIKIGPLVEFYGIRIGIVGVVLGLLGFGSLFLP